MRITEIKLTNNKIIDIISNTKTGEEAKTLAIKYSPRLFGDTSLYVTNESIIINSNEFDNKSNYISNKNTKEFMVSFFMDNITQVLNIKAAEVPEAYNSIKLKYGIQEDVLMMIYETNQSKNSIVPALNLSKHMILTRDTYRINNVLNKATLKIQQDGILYMHEYNLSLLLSLIRDFCSGDYTWVHKEIVIQALASIIHYVNPSKFTFNVEDTGFCNQKFKDKYTRASYGILETLTKMNIDIKLYNKWLIKKGNIVQIN